MSNDEEREVTLNLSVDIAALIEAEPRTPLALAAMTLAVAATLVAHDVPIGFFATRVAGLMDKLRRAPDSRDEA